MLVRHDLASKEYIFQILRLLVLEDVEVGHIDQCKGYPEHKCNLMLVQIVHQLGREREVHLWDNVKCSACRIHQVYVEGRVVKIEWSLVANNGITGHVKRADSPVDIVNHPSMCNHNPLWRTSRARGENGVYRIRVDLSSKIILCVDIGFRLVFKYVLYHDDLLVAHSFHLLFVNPVGNDDLRLQHVKDRKYATVGRLGI